MALVADKSHITGCFSNYGRDCVSRNIIFTKKDEILFGKKKVIKVSAYGNIAEVKKNNFKSKKFYLNFTKGIRRS